MEFVIKDCVGATKYVPKTENAVAFRIWNSEVEWNNKYGVLMKHRYPLGIFDYVFDDFAVDTLRDIEDYIKEGVFDYLPITPELSKKLVADFLSVKDRAEEVLVHCTQGESRSPAVASALARIAGMEEESERVQLEFPSFNASVYQAVLVWGVGITKL